MSDAKIPLERWYHIVSEAHWSGFAQMKRDFNSVDSVGNQHYVFNIGGNKYRLVVVEHDYHFSCACVVISL